MTFSKSGKVRRFGWKVCRQGKYADLEGIYADKKVVTSYKIWQSGRLFPGRESRFNISDLRSEQSYFII